MDCIYLEEDEIYETQCGEIFFTTKGRLIFHCTLCDDKKFDGFDSFEIHLKEHIPISENDCKKSAPTHIFESNDNKDYLDLQETKYDQYDNELDDDSLYSIKIESPAEESSTTSKKSAVIQNFEHVLSEKILSTKGSEIVGKRNKCKSFSQQLENEISEYRKKFGKTSFSHDAESSTIITVEIPDIVRAVRPRFSQRSLLTPDEERKHKCPVCGSAFKDRHNMIHHLKRHSDNRDHKCPECDKRFFTTSEVNIHLKSHKSERPFLCNICGKSFAYNNQMLTHFKRHTNQKQHKCEICGKAFFDYYLLKRHMVSHGSERPFTCAICSASFARKRTLINHNKLHQNKREYKCELCDSRFNQRAGVLSHIRAAHKGSKMQC